MKKISLTQGRFALVDDEDYEYLSKWNWYVSNTGYAMRTQYLGGGRANEKKVHIHMHRVINNTPEGMQTDHIDGDRLDNRKSNLRSCQEVDNHKNVGISSRNTSGYKGVSLCHTKDKWRARIVATIDGIRKEIWLGTFDDKLEAAKAYDEASKKYHSEYARHNNLGRNTYGSTTI